MIIASLVVMALLLIWAYVHMYLLLKRIVELTIRVDSLEKVANKTVDIIYKMAENYAEEKFK